MAVDRSPMNVSRQQTSPPSAPVAHQERRSSRVASARSRSTSSDRRATSSGPNTPRTCRKPVAVEERTHLHRVVVEGERAGQVVAHEGAAASWSYTGRS